MSSGDSACGNRTTVDCLTVSTMAENPTVQVRGGFRFDAMLRCGTNHPTGRIIPIGR